MPKVGAESREVKKPGDWGAEGPGGAAAGSARRTRGHLKPHSSRQSIKRAKYVVIEENIFSKEQ